jgi:hypothetical protein
MLAPLATLAFLATLLLIARVIAETLEESGGKIIAALRGQPQVQAPALPAVRVRISSTRSVQPVRAAQPWRAAA